MTSGITIRTLKPFACLILYVISVFQLSGQSVRSLEERFDSIMSRKEFSHSRFGIKVYSLDTGRVVYELNSKQLFVPGSTTKLITEGTALKILGADFRFHTRIYRTGSINREGILNGDLVLIASGDPNLSNRIKSDGTLAYENQDHSYGGPDSKGLPGDPLAVMDEFARQIAMKGIKEVKGDVVIDASLFPEGERELGTDVVISPVVLNDNIIDIFVSPGAKEGDPLSLKIVPESTYVQFTNATVTAKQGSGFSVDVQSAAGNPDGNQRATVTGAMPIGSGPSLIGYRVPSPSRFAATTLLEALKRHGIKCRGGGVYVGDSKTRNFAQKLISEHLIAEHISPPLKEETKVTLKVSQNLHASIVPFLLGSLNGHSGGEAKQKGFDLEKEFLLRNGFELTGASQNDGAGGDAYFTPDFIVQFLVFMSKQSEFQDFKSSLPILGRDGSLFKTQVSSKAAGHVFAKTGTTVVYNALNRTGLVSGKSLAGYIDTLDGKHFAFAVFVNMVPLSGEDPDEPRTVAGEALGEIASAAYDTLNSAKDTPDLDVLIRDGKIIDGSGNPWVSGDIGIRGDRIVAIGHIDPIRAKRVVDAKGLAISPGFIDMLGQSEIPLLVDNRSLSKLSQGITSEITGEGITITPQNDLTRAFWKPYLDPYNVSADWSNLDEYFNRVLRIGTPLNIGTYVGAAQVREAVLGDVDRPPTVVELEQMKAHVAEAMKQGAFGLSTALIYPPGYFAKTDELIALARVASQYGGIYATHMRGEGRGQFQALQEALQIGREAKLPVEIFHLKVAGKSRWGSMSKVVATIQAARDQGQDVTADMYPYTAGGTSLSASLPPWVSDGGTEELLRRLGDPKERTRIKSEMQVDSPQWENLYLYSGGASGVTISGVKNPELKRFDGMTIAQVAQIQKKSDLDALFDLIVADKALTGALYFIADEQDLKLGLQQEWTSLCLDAGELSLDGPLFEPHAHPRAFGTMPRFLGRYVRDQHLLPLEQAVRKMTSLPAQRMRLVDRGLLREGYFADITVFDPNLIIDTATYDHPASLAQGVKYVFVNGQLEFENGRLTGVTAGRALRGRGWIH